jgi:putative transposase
MGVATLSPGTLVAFDGAQHRMERMTGETEWELLEVRTNRASYWEEKELLRKYAKRALTFPQNGAPVETGRTYVEQGPEEWEKIKVRRLYVLASLKVDSKPALTEAIKKIWEEIKQPAQPPGIVTVYRWKKRYVNAGKDARALGDNTAKRGNRKPRFPQETIDFCQQAIALRFMSPEERTVQDTLEKALLLTQRENNRRPQNTPFRMPTRRLVESLIAKIPAFDKRAARKGHQSAVRAFRQVLGNHVTEAPLECAEIDHTPLDMIVVDDERSLPLGRPHVTACIDHYTRCILGIHITFAPPNFHSVAQCLKHSFLPKTALREEYPAIKHEWQAHGVMRTLLVDNGMDFHSKSLENACYSLGIVMRYSPRKTPWFKGAIERWFRELNRNVAHPNPGTTFSNILAKGDYDPSKDAVVTYSMLKQQLLGWVSDVYHRERHSALNMSPSQKWEESNLAQGDIELACDLDELDMIMGRAEERVLTHKGIEFAGLFYNSIELKSLRMREGEKLKVGVQVDDGDIGHVYVVYPKTGETFKVPAIRGDYATGISLWLHERLQGYQASHPDLSTGPDGWLEAKDRLERLVEEDFQLKKRRTRKAQARFKLDSKAASQKRQLQLNPPSAPAMLSAVSSALAATSNSYGIAGENEQIDDSHHVAPADNMRVAFPVSRKVRVAR